MTRELPHLRLRRVRFLALLLSGLVLLATFAPASASAATGDVSDYLARINALRASVGVQPLAVDGELTAGAQAWAQHMAATDTLAHAPDITSGITAYWLKVGENVGVGPDNATIWSAFLGSAKHYQNLVDPAFNRVGVGVAFGGGHQYTCHRFMQVGGSAPSAPAPRASAPRAPRPAAPAPPPTTTAPPQATPVDLAPPAPQPGPPPPADSTRVAVMLAALRVLSA